LKESIQIPGSSSPTLPYVSVDWPDDQENSVVLDLEKGGYDATRHLLEHHHERIGLIMTNKELANTRPVLAGYKRALAESNLPFMPDLVVNVTGFLMTDGQFGAARLLERSPRPTAILAISDMQALGVMKVIREKKMRIPEDVALIGMGDIDLADMVEPRLTSISLPARELGREGMKLLEQLIKEKPIPVNHITLPTHIVTRESCGCRIS
jgi:DNA-binding LacI/PurR family transcriptional regulator